MRTFTFTNKLRKKEPIQILFPVTTKKSSTVRRNANKYIPFRSTVISAENIKSS